jgi:hypothetical protein
VDHFIPWARYADNGVDNLVIADPRCNGSKRDFLASSEHVERWAHRFTAGGNPVRDQLAEIAQRAGFDRHPEQTLNVARTIYSRLPERAAEREVYLDVCKPKGSISSVSVEPGSRSL